MKSIDEILDTPRAKKPTTPELQKEIYELKYGKVCPKCHGLKVLPEYLHNKNGKCFMCNGKGRIN